MPYAEKLKDTLEKTMAHIYFPTSGHVNNSSNGYAKEDEKGKKRKDGGQPQKTLNKFRRRINEEKSSSRYPCRFIRT